MDAKATMLLAILWAILFQWYSNTFLEVPQEHHSLTNNFFAETYHEARNLFQQHAMAAEAVLYSIPYPHAYLDLSIDIAVFPSRQPKDLVVHFSGVHGVEGFAGSAIQTAYMESLARGSQMNIQKDTTVVFVHAVNPYGYAKLRRVNENNVDLNRNHLTRDQFEEKNAEDPNQHGYADLNEFLNPKVDRSFTVLTRLVWFFLTLGYEHCFRAIVAGTYHYKGGIYYGGNELQPSHQLLQQFFQDNLDLTAYSTVVMIDVHTGLGSRGVATLDVAISPASVDKSNILEHYGLNADAEFWSGYDTTVGTANEGYLKWFSNTTIGIAITQEFGTVSSVAVLSALIRENAAAHYFKHTRLYAAEGLRDVFYLHNDPKWKFDVVKQGVQLIEQIAHSNDDTIHQECKK